MQAGCATKLSTTQSRRPHRRRPHPHHLVPLSGTASTVGLSLHGTTRGATRP